MQLQWLQLMPGDLGDPRLNNYFLENIYQFLIGRSESLWHLDFFYPHPWILGLSDNLFGAAPVYLVGRFASLSSDTAFQLWFFVSYAANYAASYIALRRLRLSSRGAIVGALIFTFALPISAQFQHAQLLYRFGAALAIGEAGRFMASHNWRHLYSSAGWLVWQFYCSIYIGFFASLFIVVALGVHLLLRVRGWLKVRGSAPAVDGGSPWSRFPAAVRQFWGNQTMRDRAAIVLGPIAGLAAMLVLMIPYVQASRTFLATRSFADIEMDMPRPWSYLVSDHSLLWAHNARILGVGHGEEHQLFVGLGALVLFGLGAWVVASRREERVFHALGFALLATFIMSLDVGGHSLWEPFMGLPLFSAIRVVSRFDLIWLFPIGMYGGLVFDQLIMSRLQGSKHNSSGRSRQLSWIIFLCLVTMLIAEYSLVVPLTTAKVAWRSRVEAIEAITPKSIAPDAILAFATPDAPWHCATELDGMWVALNRGVPTINGYAGFGLPGYHFPAGTDRSQVLERLGWSLLYANEKGNSDAYESLANRVVLVGFDELDVADVSWLTGPHTLTESEKLYSDAELRALLIRVVGADPSRGMGVIDIELSNSGQQAIPATSFAGRSVNLVWRYVRPDGGVSGWHRRSLPCDLLPGETVRMRVLIDEVVGDGEGAIEFGVEQEGATTPAPQGTPESRVDWADR